MGVLKRRLSCFQNNIDGNVLVVIILKAVVVKIHKDFDWEYGNWKFLKTLHNLRKKTFSVKTIQKIAWFKCWE